MSRGYKATARDHPIIPQCESSVIKMLAHPSPMQGRLCCGVEGEGEREAGEGRSRVMMDRVESTEGEE